MFSSNLESVDEPARRLICKPTRYREDVDDGEFNNLTRQECCHSKKPAVVSFDISQNLNGYLFFLDDEDDELIKRKRPERFSGTKIIPSRPSCE